MFFFYSLLFNQEYMYIYIYIYIYNNNNKYQSVYNIIKLL